MGGNCIDGVEFDGDRGHRGREAEEHDEEVGSEEERRRDAQDARAALAARVSLVLESLVSRGVLQKCGQEDAEQRWLWLGARETRDLVLPKRAKNRPKKGEGPRVAASVCA